jgi:hypothetical protein
MISTSSLSHSKQLNVKNVTNQYGDKHIQNDIKIQMKHVLTLSVLLTQHFMFRHKTPYLI